jgi:amino acid adenylation domain-containing protein
VSELFHELFLAEAERTPHATALAGHGPDITYAQLARHSTHIARQLTHAGLTPETRVAICLNRSPDWVAALLGTWQAGGTYVPLDPEYPPHRLHYMLTDSNATILITTPATATQLNTANLHVLNPQPPPPEPRHTPPGHTPPPIHPDNLAYLIYTSGSTGQPKGVMITHGGVANLHQAQRDALELGQDLRVLQFASPSFDASIWEVIMALGNGGTLVLPPANEAMASLDLAELIRRHNVTIATLPPVILPRLDPAELPSLRTVISAGEDCPADLAAAWAPHVTFVNAYGPTETTVCATMAPASGDRHPPIGKPVANVQVYVLDEHHQPLPPGIGGELHIGGTGLARGYHNQPALTARHFTPDPHATTPGTRLYHTGDRARWLPDGNLEYLGRTDHQIKLRGYRIEPAEIEHALRQHPHITQAAVIIREDRPGDRRLTAYITTRTNPPPNPDQLRTHLTRHLPAHLIPAHIINLPQLPRTPNGKLDRTQLPPPPPPATPTPGHTPATHPEHQLTRIWAHTLGLPPPAINPTHNFFDLGGDSLLLLRANRDLRRLLRRDIPVVAMFAHPSIRAMAAYLSAESSAPSSAPSAVLAQGDDPASAPATTGRRRGAMRKEAMTYRHRRSR